MFPFFIFNFLGANFDVPFSLGSKHEITQWWCWCVSSFVLSFFLFEEIKNRINSTFTRKVKEADMSFYLSVSPSFSHTLLTFAKSALKIYIRFPFDLDENTSSKKKITNQRKCENVSYDFIAIKNVFWLAVCFLNSCEKRRTRKARRKKQSNKNSQNILEHSGTLCFCLVCGFIWCELFKTSNKLYIIVLLVSIERQWDWLTHTHKRTLRHPNAHLIGLEMKFI